jgi:hypothetical protein
MTSLGANPFPLAIGTTSQKRFMTASYFLDVVGSTKMGIDRTPGKMPKVGENLSYLPPLALTSAVI